MSKSMKTLSVIYLYSMQCYNQLIHYISKLDWNFGLNVTVWVDYFCEWLPFCFIYFWILIYIVSLVFLEAGTSGSCLPLAGLLPVKLYTPGKPNISGLFAKAPKYVGMLFQIHGSGRSGVGGRSLPGSQSHISGRQKSQRLETTWKFVG